MNDLSRNLDADPDRLQAEESYRAIFDCANDAIFVHDIETGRILDANQKMCELFGYTVAEVCQLTVGHISSGVPPHSQLDALHWIRKTLTEGPQVVEWVGKKKSGELFWAEVNLKEATIGGQSRLLAIVRDITERRDAEEALRRSQHRLTLQSEIDQVFLTVPDNEMYEKVLSLVVRAVESELGAFGYIDENGACVVPSLRGDVWAQCRMPEKTIIYPQETWGNSSWVRALREKRTILRNSPSTVPEGHVPILRNVATPIVHRDEVIGVLTVANKATDYDDEDVHRLETIANHIAPILNARLRQQQEERTRRVAEKALRESEERYRGLVDHSPIPILVHTGSEIVFLNPEAIRVLGGTSLEQFVGRTIWELLHEDEREMVEERLRAVHERGERAEPVEHRVVRLDGTVIQVEVSGSPIIFEGRPSTQVVVRDVSERRLLEEQLRHSQKMEGIGRLAGGIAHDFNNILQAILGYVDIALERTSPADERYDLLGRVRNGARRAADLTGQLLVFSRRQLLEPRAFNIDQLLAGMMQMLQRLIREDIELEYLPGADVKTIHADPGQIEQTVLNLCLNARDATAGSGRILISTRKAVLSSEFCREHPWAREGSFVVLSVSDSGTGMAAETRRRMFEPFFTTKEVGKGTGLGLATVYGIVKQHDGFLHVRSEPGAGTTFEVYLPAVATADSGAWIPPGGRTDERRKTVLVAEDDEMVRELNRRILEEAGYRVLTAADGREAVEIFRSHAGEISLALLDVVMPKLGGLEVHNKIRAIDPSVPVLFCSGYSPEAIHAQFIRDESAQVIRKPHSPHALLERVREALAEQPTGATATD